MIEDVAFIGERYSEGGGIFVQLELQGALDVDVL